MAATAVSDLTQSEQSTVSWGAVIAGGMAAAALSLFLLALGVGLGLSSISPWSDQGVSATTFKVGTGIYIICVAMLSSAVGGYLAGRLRATWAGVHNDEIYFRDTAHGLLAWAFATILGATALAAATTHIVAGAAAGSLLPRRQQRPRRRDSRPTFTSIRCCAPSRGQWAPMRMLQTSLRRVLLTRAPKSAG